MDYVKEKFHGLCLGLAVPQFALIWPHGILCQCYQGYKVIRDQDNEVVLIDKLLSVRFILLNLTILFEKLHYLREVYIL